MSLVADIIELVATLRTSVGAMPLPAAIEILHQLVGPNIRVSYEAPGDDKPSRVILTTNRTHADFRHELVRQCNGVVLEYPTWNVLALPARMFGPPVRNRYINIDDYTIYDVKDGTTITLYWYIDQWRLSSTNGYDVTDLRWMGDITYMQAFNEIAAAYPEFSLDKLDKNKSYTIGFRHHKFHPLLTDPQKMWLIQTTDLAQINAQNSPGVVTDTKAELGLPLQTVPELAERSVKWLLARNAEALDQYLSTLRNNIAPRIHYGYVLRSKSGGPDIILESKLLKKVRNLMYNLPKRGMYITVNIQDRLEYTILRSYLNVNSHAVFKTLFPQYESYYQKYDAVFWKLANGIVANIRNRTPVGSSKPTRRNRGPSNDVIEALAASMAARLERTTKINVMDPNSNDIVKDYLMDVRNLDMYYIQLFAHKSQ